MATYRAEQDADSPLARWRFEEPSGTTLTDDVGSVVATITGSVTPGSTLPSRPAASTGADFAGGGASMTGVSAWRPQTVEALVTFDTIPSTSSTSRPWIFGHDGTTSSNPIPMILGLNLDNQSSSRGRIGFGWWSGSGYRVLHYSTPPATGRMLHVVGTYDGSGTLKIYIDGVLCANGTGFTPRGTLTGVSTTAWIGRRFDGTAQIDGRLWDLALYNNELSSTRVSDHYAASALPAGLEITGGGALSFLGEEDVTYTDWALSGGGLIAFRATRLDPAVPRVVDFAAHPNDPSMTISPWFLEEKFPDGTTFKQGDHSTWVYTPGGQIERVLGSVRSTRTDTDFLSLATAADPSIRNPIEWGPAFRSTWRPAQVDFDIRASVGAWPSGMRWSQNLFVAWQRTGADVTIAQDDKTWWSNLCVVHKRYNWAGQPTAATPTVTARDVVHDIIGRSLGRVLEYDPARVQPGTKWSTTITHAAWWNGVSAREALEFAGTHAPGTWWQVVEPGPSGRPKMLIGRWDGPARYVLPMGSGVEMSGGGSDVANRCLIRYIGTTYGNTKTVWVAVVRANLRGLAEAGITRAMTLDLTGEGLMSPVEARKRGLVALRKAAQAKTEGRVTVREPIFDRQAGRMVDPWEIEPGCTVIVPDAPMSYGRSTSMTESVGADGIAVFRLTGVAYEIAGNTATLALDGGSRSLIGRMKTEGAQRRYDVGSARV